MSHFVISVLSLFLLFLHSPAIVVAAGGQETQIILRREAGNQQSVSPAPAQQPPDTAIPAGQQPDAPRAILRGHVYAQDTGAPLKRAQVTLRMDRRQGEPQTTITDAQGAFELKNVEAGSYTLYCSRSGYVSANYGQKAPNQPPVPLTVRPGQELKDLEFRLIRGGVISGTVMDEDGEPLSNVHVQALVKQYAQGQSRLMPRGSASTDDRGQYRIFNLPPGRYYVQTSMRGFGDQESSYAPILYPNVLTLQDAQRIEVTKGAEVARVDFRMRPVPTYSVSGRVIDQLTGGPLPDAAVGAMSSDGQSQSFNQVRPDGSFRLRGLLPGRYRLMVMRTQRGGMGPMANRPMVKTFDLGPANIENMVITVGPGVSVRGRLVAEGGILSAGNLRVNLAPRGEGIYFGPVLGSGTVNQDLTFELTGVQPGEYNVSVFASNSPASMLPASGAGQNTQFYVREVRVGGQDVVDRGLTVAEGAPVADLEVVLDFAGGTVTGRVLNDRDEPTSGVQVALLSADREKRGSDRYFRAGAADQNGQFSLRAVIPGEYLLVAWPEADVARVQDPELFAQLEKHAVRVTVEKSAIANKDIKLTSEIQTIAQAFAQ